jgi:hypothetical protein
MTTKDYIYLGLILLTALAFYCNGFYAGVYRCKRVYDTLIDESEADADTTPSPDESGKSVAVQDKAFATVSPLRESSVILPSRDLRGNFSNN